MLVLSMNSKRQRRSNVRLGEIGNVSAAYACGISHRTGANLGQHSWNHDFLVHKESEYNPTCGFSQQRPSGVTASDPGVSSRISADMQQNRENKNPNSLSPVLEFGNLDEIDVCKSKLDFGTITRKCRLMNRRRRSARGNCGVFSGAWNSKISPEISSGDVNEYRENEYREKEVAGFTSNGCLDIYQVCGFKESSCHETLATSKEACEDDNDEPTSNDQMRENPNCFGREASCSEGNNAFPQSFGGCDMIKIGGNDVNSVRRWLEELGFGKYAGMFEMHEVDEEALPLLTLEDLKEMGVLAVGPRRKLYTAIQMLREGGEWVTA